jgi:hypothetical protein
VRRKEGVMKDAFRNHWITALAALSAAFLVATGIAMIVSGGEFGETEVRIFGVVGSIAGLALITGLWGLRGGQLTRWVAHALIVAGLVVLGAGFWWFVFVPPVVALAVLYAGVIRGGLERELRPA